MDSRKAAFLFKSTIYTGIFFNSSQDVCTRKIISNENTAIIQLFELFMM